MKRTIKLNKNGLSRIINESIRQILSEKVKAKKLQQLADEHGGFDYSYFRNGGGIGSPYRGYVSEMPDDCVLGVGKVDLHTYPHKNFEINGISDEDMEQLRLRDGQYLYYDKRKMQEYFGDKINAKRKNNDTRDGAFAYQGKYADAIQKKKWGGYEDSFQAKFFEKIKNCKKALAISKNNLQTLLGMNTAFNIDGDVEDVLEKIENLEATLENVENNAIDNFTNMGEDGGHYWRPNQPKNVQKYMKARDSRRVNRGGRTDTYFDVQGGGLWGHDNTRSRNRYKYTTAGYK